MESVYVFINNSTEKFSQVKVIFVKRHEISINMVQSLNLRSLSQLKKCKLRNTFLNARMSSILLTRARVTNPNL
jgi:hypothetical protein